VYRERQRRELLPKVQLGLATGAVLFVAFLAWDLAVAPGVMLRTLPVRVGMALLLLGCSALSRLPPVARAPEALLCLAVSLTAAPMVWIAVTTPQGPTFVVGALMLTIMVSVALVPTMRAALPTYGLPLAVANLTAHVMDAPALLFLSLNAFCGMGAVVGVVLAWFSERQDVRAWSLEEALREQALTDALTGLLNRRAFLESAGGELVRAARHHYPVSLLMVDIDRFKRINDTWGHPTGDAVIRALARVCADTVRKSDPCARMGGEEFALLLPHSELQGALELAERLREAVGRVEVPDARGAVRCTVSIGVAQWQPGEGLDALLQHADEALYASKRAGRDRVTPAPLTATAPAVAATG
jgi:diguanylate cyclase (GGDEF)-like protein